MWLSGQFKLTRGLFQRASVLDESRQINQIHTESKVYNYMTRNEMPI